MADGISIIIPTRNGGALFAESIRAISHQDYDGPVEVIVVDSGSMDGTPEVAASGGARVIRIRPETFHHARTRNEAVSFATFGRVVFMVQDAVPCTPDWLSSLARSLDEKGTAAVYTDQVPHDDASLFARLETESIRRARGDRPVLQRLESLEAFYAMPYEKAYRAIGLDNVCAIYRKELLLCIPFPEVDFAEDMAWAFRMLLVGHTILYNPAIKVKHSHDRTPEYGFARQIVNSVWCARIMNRVREDLSYLTPTTLLALLEAARRVVLELREDMEAPPGEGLDPMDRLIRMAPLRYRLATCILNTLRPKGRPMEPGLFRIQHQIENEIRSLFNVTREEHPEATADALADALDGIGANVVGRVFGEAYASCLLKGGVPRRLKILTGAYGTAV